VNWEVKYKSLRAAFLEMSKRATREKKNHSKEIQRLKQVIFDLKKEKPNGR